MILPNVSARLSYEGNLCSKKMYVGKIFKESLQ